MNKAEVGGQVNWIEYSRFRKGFAEAMDPRFYTLDWLDRQLWLGRFKFWWTDNAAVVTELVLYPSGARGMLFRYATGDLREIVEIIRPDAEEWARRQGCQFVSVNSREAWQRILEPLGYQPYKVEVLKEL